MAFKIDKEQWKKYVNKQRIYRCYTQIFVLNFLAWSIDPQSSAEDSGCFLVLCYCWFSVKYNSTSNVCCRSGIISRDRQKIFLLPWSIAKLILTIFTHHFLHSFTLPYFYQFQNSLPYMVERVLYWPQSPWCLVSCKITLSWLQASDIRRFYNVALCN